VLMEGKDGNCRTYKHQLEQCQNRADALTKENIALTDKLQSQRAATQRAQDESRSVSDRWEGGATKDERKALEDSLAQREALYAGLAREAEQARVHADIASEQVASIRIRRSWRTCARPCFSWGRGRMTTRSLASSHWSCRK
jgi:predicted RNase H-like nuclease (RuvC/YqgF family)